MGLLSQACGGTFWGIPGPQTTIPAASQCTSSACHVRHAIRGCAGSPETRASSPYLGHNALFYESLTRQSDHGPRIGRRDGRVGVIRHSVCSGGAASGSSRRPWVHRSPGHFTAPQLQAAAAGCGDLRSAALSPAADQRAPRAGRRPLGAQRLAGPLRHPAGRPGRAMRADPERDRRRPRQCRPHRDRAQDRRPEEPADAGGRARWACCCPPGSGSRSTRPTSAAPASSAACPTAASPRWSWTKPWSSRCAPAQTATFIIFQTPGGRHRLPDEPEGLRRRLRQAAVESLLRCGNVRIIFRRMRRLVPFHPPIVRLSVRPDDDEPKAVVASRSARPRQPHTDATFAAVRRPDRSRPRSAMARSGRAPG